MSTSIEQQQSVICPNEQVHAPQSTTENFTAKLVLVHPYLWTLQTTDVYVHVHTLLNQTYRTRIAPQSLIEAWRVL